MFLPPFRRWPAPGLLTRLELDQAVAFSLATRFWQLAAGPVTLVLIALYFSPEEQGYYYAFANLMAMQAFLELGLNIVVLNLASGQWAHLQLNEAGRATGDPAALARLGNLLRRLLQWYTVVAVLFVLLVGGYGYFFLQAEETKATHWQQPWWALTLLTAGLTWTYPLVSLLEGCHRVAEVNRYRLTGAVLGNVAVWAVMLSGGGLWAAPASAAVRLACDAHLTGIRFRPLLASLLATPRRPALRWRFDVWPLQWRQALIVSFQYFEISLLTLIIFAYHGKVMAGQTGMTWTLSITLHTAALAWVQTRAPQFGSLVARQEYHQLNQLFRRVTLIALAAAVLGMLAMGGAVWAMDAFDFHLRGRRLADRLLPLPTLMLYLAVACLRVPPWCMAYYVRAHRKEPLLVVSLASSTAAGLLVWWGGWQYGPLGAGLGLLSSTLLINLPGHTYVWQRFRRQHGRIR